MNVLVSYNESNSQRELTESNLFPKDENTNDESKCLSIACWIFQILVWISIIIIIIGAVIIKKKIIMLGGVISLCVSYIIYLILEFCSPTGKYLMNIRDGESIYEKMGKLFITAPVINFYAECHHYYIRHYTTRDQKGRRHSNTVKRKVVTHTDSYNLPYYSFKDVSGLFLLNENEAEMKKKKYIKLYLKKEINFADTISYSDYINQKNLFWKRNRYLDSRMNFTETRDIPGMKEYNLVKIGTNEPKCFDIYWYVISVLLTLGQLYKKYIDSFCVYKIFKIRKLISTRYNLLEEQYIQQYQPLMPQLNLVVQQYNYEPKNTGYCSKDVEPVLPTKEEIEQAEKYQDQIPNYGITSNDGVIQDIPQFNKPNYNIPPPDFVSIGGNVDLNKNEINKNQNIPMSHDYIRGDFSGNNNDNNTNQIQVYNAQNKD